MRTETGYHIGFTGTHLGMTTEQKAEVVRLLSIVKTSAERIVLHHGDCIGADADCHQIAKDLGCAIVIHPPVKEYRRAFCKEADEVCEPFDYLVRDRHIVNAAIEMLATPAGFQEELRSGTWATVRYARRIGKIPVVVYPDGTAIKE